MLKPTKFYGEGRSGETLLVYALLDVVKYFDIWIKSKSKYFDTLSSGGDFFWVTQFYVLRSILCYTLLGCDVF
jgi:hypothetical protein